MNLYYCVKQDFVANGKQYYIKAFKQECPVAIFVLFVFVLCVYVCECCCFFIIIFS